MDGSLNPKDIALTRDLAQKIFDFAGKIAETFAQSLVSTEDDKRSGGALAIHDPRRGMHQVRVVGSVSEKDGHRFGGHAANKNYATRAGDDDTIVSEQVADPEADPPVYGGGIKLPNGCFLSFSGFPPKWDQAFCILVARKFGLIDQKWEDRLIAASADPVEARACRDAAFARFPQVGVMV
ncbi:MAG: hypothetical protein ACI9H6_000463 [Patiriisocius sp.]|jgi:hypothetical protein